VNERICPRCGKSQPISEFAVDRGKSSGRKSHCKSCDREKARRYYAEHRLEALAKQKAQKRAKRDTPAHSRRIRYSTTGY
jgi:hypothetical protein